jgi:hypothetical protein
MLSSEHKSLPHVNTFGFISISRFPMVSVSFPGSQSMLFTLARPSIVTSYAPHPINNCDVPQIAAQEAANFNQLESAGFLTFPPRTLISHNGGLLTRQRGSG